MPRTVYRRKPGTDQLEMVVIDHEPEARIHLVTDRMPALEHPCDGRTYDSKSAFRGVTKAHGCYEMGNDAPRTPKKEYKPQGIREQIIDLRRNS